jgi:hypothetical protein
MFIAFLKSPFYDRIVRMTQYRDPYYGSDSGSDSDSDEENQYQMVRSNDMDIKNKVNQYTSDFNEADYYLVSYENTDTVFMRRCKDCMNYTSIVICLGLNILVFYIIVFIYS